MKTILLGISATFQYFILAAIVIAVFAFPTMILWNLTVPRIFNGPFVSYHDMFLLMLLTRMLFPTSANTTQNQILDNEEESI
jgi:hypothetical protein